jgi:hypothetical protein
MIGLFLLLILAHETLRSRLFACLLTPVVGAFFRTDLRRI